VNYTAEEMMTIAAARRLRNGSVCFVGIGLPSAAANLARLTHAPQVVLIYESGTIGTRPDVLPLSIGDGELAEKADSIVSMPEIFRYYLQAGRVDVGFLGAAQIDRFGNLNSTFVGGTYSHPVTRLPGAGGAPEIAASARETLIVLPQSRRAFVERLDFMSSGGYFRGTQTREQSGSTGLGPMAVITDLGILTPDPVSREMTLSSLHPGIDVETAIARTGWPLRLAATVETTKIPEEHELQVLRDLLARTRAAHGVTS
jgi:glutaconate CoA-transferase subunit B